MSTAHVVELFSGHDTNSTGSHNIFKLTEELDDNPVALTILFLVVIVISLFFEKATHWAEHQAQKHEHMHEVLTAIYREVMILGWITLILFVVEQAGLLDVKVNGNQFNILLFEFIHIFIFFTAIFFIMAILLVLAFLNVTWKLWEHNEQTPEETIRDEYAKVEKEALMRGRHFYWNPALAYRYYTKRRALYFNQIRLRFIQTQLVYMKETGEEEADGHGSSSGASSPGFHGPPESHGGGHKDSHAHGGDHGHRTHGSSIKPGGHHHAVVDPVGQFLQQQLMDDRQLRVDMLLGFRFAKYLRRCARNVVLRLINIDFKVWILFILIALLNLIRLLAGGNYHSGDHGVKGFIGIGWALLAIFFVAYMIQSHYLKMYFERAVELCPLDAAAVEEAKMEYLKADQAHSSSHNPLTRQPTGKIHPIEQSSYFFLGKPEWSLTVLQVLVLSQAFYLALYVLAFAYRIGYYNHGAGEAFGLHMATLLPPILVIGFIMPNLLPGFTLLESVEDLSKHEFAEHVLVRMMVSGRIKPPIRAAEITELIVEHEQEVEKDPHSLGVDYFAEATTPSTEPSTSIEMKQQGSVTGSSSPETTTQSGGGSSVKVPSPTDLPMASTEITTRQTAMSIVTGRPVSHTTRPSVTTTTTTSLRPGMSMRAPKTRTAEDDDYAPRPMSMNVHHMVKNTAGSS